MVGCELNNLPIFALSWFHFLSSISRPHNLCSLNINTPRRRRSDANRIITCCCCSSSWEHSKSRKNERKIRQMNIFSIFVKNSQSNFTLSTTTWRIEVKKIKFYIVVISVKTRLKVTGNLLCQIFLNLDLTFSINYLLVFER